MFRFVVRDIALLGNEPIIATAMPPDVRRWLRPAVRPLMKLGCALGAGFAPD